MPLRTIVASSVVLHDMDAGDVHRVCADDVAKQVSGWEWLIAQGFPARSKCQRGRAQSIVCILQYTTPNHQFVLLATVFDPAGSRVVGISKATRSTPPPPADLPAAVTRFLAMIADESLERCR